MQLGTLYLEMGVSTMIALAPGTCPRSLAMASPWWTGSGSVASEVTRSRIEDSMTRSGLRLLSLVTTSFRQVSHSVYIRENQCEYSGMSRNRHDSLMNGTSRQPRAFAIARIAGNQWAACESPTSATVNVPFLLA